jgi:hypothetical protein
MQGEFLGAFQSVLGQDAQVDSMVMMDVCVSADNRWVLVLDDE